MILLDSNLLARMTSSDHPHCAIARRAVHAWSSSRERLVIVPQNIYEFWAAATRKAGAPPLGQNGLGMTPTLASQWLRYFRRRFTLLFDPAELVDDWLDLVTTRQISGTKSHDARLVAAMQSHGIT